MRILRVAQKVYPDVVGGGPYHVHALSRDQAAAGHDVTVLTVASEPDLPARERRDGYTVIRKPSTMSLLGNDISAGVGRFLASADDYDVIHAHSHLYFSTNVAALKRALSDVPLAITNHGLYSQTAPKRAFDYYLSTVGKWTFNAADIVFCYTEEDRRRVQSFGVDSDVEVVANGIDETKFNPDGPTSDHVDDDGSVVLFVGRLVEGKRPEIALEAVAKVREEHPDVHLYFCGEGQRHGAVERRADELGIADSVTFLGHVDYQEMPRIYRSADLLILPSRAEGLPRTVLEALATETPVVTSDLEQLAPIVDEAGYRVRTDDVETFADVIDELLDDEERRRTCSRRGRELIRERFRWTETVEQTTDKLAEITDSSPDLDRSV